MTPTQGSTVLITRPPAIHPAAALLTAAVIVVSTSLVATNNYLLLALHALLLPPLWLFIRARIVQVILRLVVVAPFVLLASILILMMDLGGPWIVLGLGPLSITFSALAVDLFLEVITKAAIAVLALAIVAAGFKAQGLLCALATLRLPKTMLLLVGQILRFGYLTAESARTMERARIARAGEGGGRLGFWAAGSGLGSLLARSLARSERVQRAMLARGFDGSLQLLSVPPVRVKDYIFLFSALVGAVVLWLVLG